MDLRSTRKWQVGIWALAALLALALLALSSNALAVGESSSASSDSSASASSSQDAGSSESSSSSSSASSSAASSSSSSVSARFAVSTEVDNALGSEVAPKSASNINVDTDSAGTLFTFDTPLEEVRVGSDLYWAGDRLALTRSKVGNDVMALARDMSMERVNIGGDIRLAAQNAHLDTVVAQGNVDLLAFDVTIGKGSAAQGYYCGGGHISYEGASKRFIAYGQSIYFNGIVDGDVTLSAQEIVIGEHARVTGTLDIRSGQSVETLIIPESAWIAHLDTTMNHPNTIDQITELRAHIAPYFQMGSMLFAVVSFIIMGLAFLWGFGHKMTEANRLVRRYPLAMLVLGCIAIMLMLVLILLGPLLVFTIPLSVVALFALLICIICCVPFTGASLALIFHKRFHPALCTVVGSGLGAALLFVPYLNQAIVVASLIYFVGYLINIAMFGHDKYHDSSFLHRQEVEEDERSRAILPVSAEGDVLVS